MVILDAIVLGGGLGTRFSESGSGNSTLPKQFQLLANKPVFIHCLQSLLGMGCFRQIALTVPKPYVGLARDLIDSFFPQVTQIRVVVGGERRQDSSRLALEALEENSVPPTRVLIHDACRPFLSKELLANVKKHLLDRSYGAWVPVVPVIETLKKIENQQVVESVDRNLVHRVQTPQIFEYTVIRSLMDRIKDLSEMVFTDDASLCEYYGIPVGAFEGDVRNIKLTYPFEMEGLRSMLAEPKKEDSCAPASDTTYTV